MKSSEPLEPPPLSAINCAAPVNESTSLLLPPLTGHSHIEDDILSEADRAKGRKEMRILIVACCLTCFFFLVELVGGYYANSLAVMSDAAHLLSDLIGLIISLLAVTFSRIPACEMMSFGYARAEVLGAFVSLIFIWTLTAALVVAAIGRIWHPTMVNGRLMLLLGAIGLAVNIALGVVLGHDHAHHGHSHHDHSHGVHNHEGDCCDSHGHGHLSDEDEEDNREGERVFLDWNRITGANIESLNVRAAYLHVLGDALQSVGVIAAAIVIMFFPKWTVVDPLCTILFAIIVLMTTKDLAIRTLGVLMEGAPPNVSIRSVNDRLRSIKGVARVGDLHIWSITMKRPALSVHMFLDGSDGSVSDHQVLKVARNTLKEEFGIEHTTIQVMSCQNDCCDDAIAKCGQQHCLTTSDLN